MIRKEARMTWVCVGGASLQAAFCQVACDFWAAAVSVLLCTFLPPGYVPDFICRSDFGSWMGPAQLLLGLTQSSLRLTSIESVMPSSHLILCHPLLLLPPIPPSIRVFSNVLASFLIIL